MGCNGFLVLGLNPTAIHFSVPSLYFPTYAGIKRRWIISRLCHRASARFDCARRIVRANMADTVVLRSIPASAFKTRFSMKKAGRKGADIFGVLNEGHIYWPTRINTISVLLFLRSATLYLRTWPYNASASSNVCWQNGVKTNSRKSLLSSHSKYATI